MADTAVVSTRVPDALAAALTALADSTGRTLSQVLRDAVEAFLHPPVTLHGAAGGRIRLLTPVWPIGGENTNLVVPETLNLTMVVGALDSVHGR